MEQESNSGEWVECVCDKRYEINLSYPYRIRRKDTKQLVREWVGRGRFGHGYVHVRLGSKDRLKHRLIALQFIPNDDPINKSCIDHINGIRTDNHLFNLRWVSNSENQKNKSSYRGKPFRFIEEMPTNATPLLNYNEHQLEDIYIDRATQKLYLYNGVRIRELEPVRVKGCSTNYYNTKDVKGNDVRLCHNRLFGNEQVVDETIDSSLEEEDID